MLAQLNGHYRRFVRPIFTSLICLKKRKVVPIVYTAKKKKPSVNVYRDMNLKELSQTLGFGIGHLNECLDYLDVERTMKDPDKSIEDPSVIGSIASLCGYRFQFVKRPNISTAKVSVDVHRRPPPLAESIQLISRPPIVTIMGHVDHGKTTLLDSLRKSRVVDQEFGGITQHIGAFTVELKSNEHFKRKIVFIDTPGHAAFCSMRARGVQVTDLVVLVVAADDGVMPQTVESLQHIRNANVPFIVAINKIDKNNANLKMTIESLLQFGVQLEESGGDIIGVQISALKKINLDQLLNAILTMTDLLELKGDPTGLVEATVIESKIDKTLGPICTALVDRGTLKKGAYLVSGATSGRVRQILNEDRQPLVKTELCEPVQIVGWSKAPKSGDDIIEVEDKKKMDLVIAFRTSKVIVEKEISDGLAADRVREEHLKKYREELKIKRETGTVFRKITGRAHIVQERKKPYLPIVMKVDVLGSLEAIEDSFKTYVSTMVDLEVIHSGIGEIAMGDVERAHAAKGIIYGFNVSAPTNVLALASTLNVPVSLHQVIYHLFNDIRNQLNERVTPVETEEALGEAVVQQVYQVDIGKSRAVSVAGCRCLNGTLRRHALYKVIRNDNEVVHRGQLSSMKHFKDDVSSVQKGQDCGLAFGSEDRFQFQKGDVLVGYKIVMIKPEVEWFVSTDSIK